MEPARCRVAPPELGNGLGSGGTARTHSARQQRQKETSDTLASTFIALGEPMNFFPSLGVAWAMRLVGSAIGFDEANRNRVPFSRQSGSR
jgi:hypothetical protein